MSARAGQRNQRITLYATKSDQSPSGAPIRTVEKVGRVWAKVTYKGGSEQTAGDTKQPVSRYEIEIRWREIKAGWWVDWKQNYLRITNIDDSDPRRQTLVLTAETVAGMLELLETESNFTDAAARMLSQVVNSGW